MPVWKFIMNLETNNKIQKKGITLVIPNPCGNIKETKMKNSGVEWIGEIPENWEVSKTKYLTKLYTGNSIKDEEKDLYEDKADAIPYISSKDINATFSTTNYENGMYVKHSDNSFVRAPAGSTLMCIEGGSAGKKKTFLNQEVCFVNKLCCFSPIKIDSKFLFYCLNSPNYEEEFRFNISGMIGGVSVGKLNQFILPKPPKSTQQRIASYLDKKCSKIEETIQNQQQVIEKLKAYKQSLITEAVTGKVKIENGKICGVYESYKDSGVEWIGKIPSGWEVKKLKYIADTFLKGSGITKEEIVINGDIPCVRYGELYTKYDYHFTECQTRTNLGIIETPKYFSHGDVLFTCTGELVEEIGKSIAYLGNEKCLAGGDIIVLKLSQDPMFMGFALDSKYVQGQKSFGKTKLKVVHISSGEIARLLIVLPSKEEQKEIADYLDKKCTAIDTTIEQKQKLIEKLTEYKKSLIYECVTGKKEI